MEADIQVASREITGAEREAASSYLLETKSSVVRSVEGLSDAQWRFKPAPDCWSIAELVEHLAVVGNRVHQLLQGFAQCPLAPPNRDPKPIDIEILRSVPDRSSKFRGPDILTPTGRWTPAESLREFLTVDGLISSILLETPGLRDHLYPHPICGPIDGYQWILLFAAHSERHLKQIDEVKASTRFPGISSEARIG